MCSTEGMGDLPVNRRGPDGIIIVKQQAPVLSQDFVLPPLHVLITALSVRLLAD